MQRHIKVVFLSRMNFLAHAYLSGDEPKILVGNFIADFVKGKLALQKFEPAIARGIELHRIIDAFTDNHEIVNESKNKLRPKYRHYAAVIVDVFYDHFLAKNWSNYHSTPLPVFAEHVYDTVKQFQAILPEGVKYMLPYMIDGNWLWNYSKIEGIERALSGMAKRTPYPSRMEEAIHELRLYYEQLKKEFEMFLPSLKHKTDQFLENEKQ
jgi:acyl carrier protein phosphodiesterase